MQPVYSLRVDTDDHSFLTNGFVSHNTEARLARLAESMLEELGSDTVDFGPNYDESKREPLVCPRASRTCSSTAAPASPSAWRRTSRRTTSPRWPPRSRRCIDKPDGERRGADEAREGPRLPDRRDRRRPLRHPRCVSHGPRPRRDARARPHRGAARRQERDHRHRAAVRGEEGWRHGRDREDRRPRQRQGADRDLRSRRPLGPHRDAHPDRAQARCSPAGRAEQAVQAHAAADDVRLQRRRARQRRAADALAARADQALPRLPARDRHAQVEVRAAAGGEARAHPAGPADRARQSRRGHPADPLRRRHRVGARRPAGAVRADRASGGGDPRAASACADGARAEARRGRVPRPAGAHRRAAHAPRGRGEDRRADQGGAARAARRPTAEATTGAPRSSQPRRSSSSRI